MADAEKPVRYMERTRRYYRALGYTRDYVWAVVDDVPFARARPITIDCGRSARSGAAAG